MEILINISYFLMPIIMEIFLINHNNEFINVTTDCKTNAQCVDNTCRYNVESNAERCDHLYTKPTISSKGKEYDYYGGMLNEYYGKDSDCSFKNCDYGRCSSNLLHWMN